MGLKGFVVVVVVVVVVVLCRYLAPCDMPVGQFIFILRSRMHLSPGTALFVFVNNTLPQTGEIVVHQYNMLSVL